MVCNLYSNGFFFFFLDINLIFRFCIFSDYPLKFFSLVVAISNALFNKTIRPSAATPSRTAAAAMAASTNQTYMTIRQQTPTNNNSPMHLRHQSSNHSTIRSHR